MQMVPWPKQCFNYFFREETSLCFTDQETQEENISPVQSSRSIQHSRHSYGQNSFFAHFLGWTSLCFTDQETQEENVLGGPTPLWVSTYTSFLLWKVQDPFSTCRHYHGQNSFFLIFLGRPVLV